MEASELKIDQTNRGFDIGHFEDTYHNTCSIQKSCAALEDCIWIGIDSPKLTVFEDEKMGKYLITALPKNWMVDSRMHLSREQVAMLLPVLIKFVETGDLT